MSECHRTKILLKGIMIVFKIKGPQIRWIPHGSFGLSQCKSSSKKTCWLTKSLERHKQIQKERFANTLHVKPYSLISCCFKRNL